MTTPNLGLAKPADHGDFDIWGAELNSNWDLLDAHDHTPGKGVSVPSAGLKINADVSWSFAGTHYAVKDALAFDLFPTTQANITGLGYRSALFADSASNSGDLTYVSPAGAFVRITNAGSLNFSVTGGFGGDYTAVGALASFVDATDVYLFQQQLGSAVRQYGKIQSADLQLFEYKAQPAAGVPANHVTLKSPTGLAGSYDLTWLAALPGSTVAMQVSSSGQISASNTFASAVTAPDYKFGTPLTLSIHAAASDINGNTRLLDANGRYGTVLSAGVSNACQTVFPIPVRVGDRITGYTLYINKVTSNTTTIGSGLRALNMATGATASTDGVSTSANSPGFTTMTVTGLSRDVVAGIEWGVSIGITAGAGVTDQVFGCEVTIIRP